MGDPVLRGKSRPVDKVDDSIINLAKDMADSIDTGYQSGVGLAAPQIGVPKRVIIIHLEEEIKTYINPEIEVLDDETEIEEEGCLSLPHLKADVPRSKKIKVKALTLEGKEIELIAEGMLARVFQHETDHLEGKLFIDRLDKKTRRQLLLQYDNEQE